MPFLPSSHTHQAGIPQTRTDAGHSLNPYRRGFNPGGGRGWGRGWFSLQSGRRGDPAALRLISASEAAALT